MPTLSSMMIPVPKSWDEFEEITLSCLKIKWQSSNLTRHGRQGQAQNGVDIYGSDELGRFVGVQCKLTKDDIGFQTVKDEVNKAENFQPKLNSFYLATTAPNDIKIQQKIRLFSCERVKNNKFPIGIFFWDDLVQELIKNELEFNKHYPQIKLSINSESKQKSRLLSLIDIAYYGINLNRFFQLIFGEMGQLAGEDPNQIFAVTNIIDICSMLLLESILSNELINKTKELTDYTLSILSGDITETHPWRTVDDLIHEIERKISLVEYNIKGRELAAFNAGILLGKLDILEIHNKKASDQLQNEINDTLKILSYDGDIPDEIANILKEYNENDDEIETYKLPHRLYSTIKKMLRYQEMKSV